MKVVPSTYHQMISYLTSARKIDLLSSQLAALAARQCYQQLIQEHKKKKKKLLQSGPRDPNLIIAITARRPSKGGGQGEIGRRPLESIFVDGPDKSTYVSSLLSSGEKEQIQQVLLRNMMYSS